MSKNYQRYPFGVRKRSETLGYMTAFDVLRVAAWKSARLPAALSVNSPSHIEQVTQQTIARLRQSECRSWSPLGNRDDAFWKRYEDLIRLLVGAKSDRTGLYALDGVQYPTASAILCVLDPHLFPVIDKWAIRAIYGTRSNGKDHTKIHCASVYTHYARTLATAIHVRRPAKTIHNLDVRAMSIGRLMQPRSSATASEVYRDDLQGWPPPVPLPPC